MEVGIAQLIASFGYPGMTDQEVYAEELQVAMLGEELGYDHVFCVEHHSATRGAAPQALQDLP